MKKFAVILLAVLLSIFVTSCGKEQAGKPEFKFQSVYWVEPRGHLFTLVDRMEYQDYHNGIYYFPYRGNNFGKILSAFIRHHPELELVSFTTNDTGIDGITVGYFVYFKNKQQESVDKPKTEK